MIYLQSFQMPTRSDEENYFANPGNFKAKSSGRVCCLADFASRILKIIIDLLENKKEVQSRE